MVISNNFKTHFAFITSVLTSPYLIVLIGGSIVIYHYSPSNTQALIWILQFAGTIIGFPLLYIIAGMLSRKISDIHVALREQRQVPIIIAIVGCFACFHLFRSAGAPKALQVLVLSSLINGLVYLTSTQYSKLSFHTGTLAAFGVILTALIDPRYAVILLIIPIASWARARRGRHTWPESILSALLSAGVVLLTLNLI